MSSTTLMGILKDGTVETIAEYRNGHGAGPYVWRLLFEYRRGVRAYDHSKLGYMNEGAGYISSKYIPQCTEEEAWVLGMTFDNAIVTRESAPAAAKHLRTFLAGPGQEPTHANHWPKILAVLEDMPEQYAGIAISHTSVCNSVMLYGIYVEDDEDDDKDEVIPYNLNVHTDHFFLTEDCIQGWRAAGEAER